MTRREPSDLPVGSRRWMMLARIVGVAVLGVSLAYLAHFISLNWSRLAAIDPAGVSAPWLLAAALLFLGNHATNSAAWLAILRWLGQRLSAREAVAITLTAQLGKYAPGNIAHQVSRAALAGQRGVSVGVVAGSAVVEIALVAFACAFIGAVVMLATPEAVTALPGLTAFAGYLPVAGAALLILLILATVLMPRLPLGPSASTIRLWRMLPYYVASCALAGASFYAVAVALGAQSLNPLVAVGVYALAWFAGFVTPGAPAGLGVREAILVALLSSAMGPASAVAAALAHRVLTAVVDACAFVAGAALLATTPRPRLSA